MQSFFSLFRIWQLKGFIQTLTYKLLMSDDFEFYLFTFMSRSVAYFKFLLGE